MISTFIAHTFKATFLPLAFVTRFSSMVLNIELSTLLSVDFSTPLNVESLSLGDVFECYDLVLLNVELSTFNDVEG